VQRYRNDWMHPSSVVQDVTRCVRVQRGCHRGGGATGVRDRVKCHGRSPDFFWVAATRPVHPRPPPPSTHPRHPTHSYAPAHTVAPDGHAPAHVGPAPQLCLIAPMPCHRLPWHTATPTPITPLYLPLYLHLPPHTHTHTSRDSAVLNITTSSTGNKFDPQLRLVGVGGNYYISLRTQQPLDGPSCDVGLEEGWYDRVYVHWWDSLKVVVLARLAAFDTYVNARDDVRVTVLDMDPSTQTALIGVDGRTQRCRPTPPQLVLTVTPSSTMSAYFPGDEPTTGDGTVDCASGSSPGTALVQVTVTSAALECGRTPTDLVFVTGDQVEGSVDSGPAPSPVPTISLPTGWRLRICGTVAVAVTVPKYALSAEVSWVIHAGDGVALMSGSGAYLTTSGLQRTQLLCTPPGTTLVFEFTDWTGRNLCVRFGGCGWYRVAVDGATVISSTAFPTRTFNRTDTRRFSLWGGRPVQAPSHPGPVCAPIRVTVRADGSPQDNGWWLWVPRDGRVLMAAGVVTPLRAVSWTTTYCGLPGERLVFSMHDYSWNGMNTTQGGGFRVEVGSTTVVEGGVLSEGHGPGLPVPARAAAGRCGGARYVRCAAGH
jgi:hypothetical protein